MTNCILKSACVLQHQRAG